jgi:hypothetical protein
MHLTGAQSEHGYLVSKPQVWSAFTLSFLLMTFDFVDRQIVVSMFPYLKAEWVLNDREFDPIRTENLMDMGVRPLVTVVEELAALNAQQGTTQL